MTFAIVTVLPEPVTPRSVTWRSPAVSASSRPAEACGWSPARSQGNASRNGAFAVAAREIPPKTQITSADLKLVRINSEAVPPAAVSDPAQVVGKITITTISVGEPILLSKLAGANGAAFVVIPIEALGANGAIQPNTPQYRAMSISVADALAAGGNIQAG